MGGLFSKTNSKSIRLQDATVRDEVDLAAREAVEDTEDLSLHTSVQINLSVSAIESEGYYCVIGYVRDSGNDWEPIGFTETSNLSQDVSFVHTLVCDYTFERPQYLRFELYRLPREDQLERIGSHNPAPLLPNHASIIDTAECFLAEVVSSPQSRIVIPLSRAKSMTVLIEEIRILQNLINFNLRVRSIDTHADLQKKKLKNFFFSIHRDLEEGVSLPAKDKGRNIDTLPQVIRSEIKSVRVADTRKLVVSELVWENLQTSVNAICRGDLRRSIIIKVWQVENSKRFLIGECSTTYNEIYFGFSSTQAKSVTLPIKGPGSGFVDIYNINIERRSSFLDYVSGGMDISLFVAIDFTKSNKDANLADSLHYMDPMGDSRNDYMKAITSICGILEHYDSDKKIPVYGFGARLPPSYTFTSHLFACNGNIFDPEVSGVSGVIDAYKQALKSVVLHGPTNFHEIIGLVSDAAKPFSDPKLSGQKPRYFILLILTDGVITDMKATVDEIVHACDYPVSIIIVGVGDEDFSLMRQLDGDDVRLYSSSEKRFAQRDIVQFVPFNKFRDAPIHTLAVETLDEIPREVVQYFKSKGIAPGPSRGSSDSGESGQTTDPSFSSYLDIQKDEFIKQVSEKYPEMTETDIRLTLLEEKLPAKNPEYFIDVAANGPHGANVFSVPAKNFSSPAAGEERKTGRVSLKASAAALTASKLATAGNRSKANALCKFCGDRPLETVVVPCGHSISCLRCSDNIGGECPQCKKRITRIIPTLPT